MPKTTAPTAYAKLSLYQIAQVIRQSWGQVYFGARPYLDAMASLDSIQDNYGADSGKEIVIYFLCNATTWKGDVAREVKKELKARTK